MAVEKVETDIIDHIFFVPSLIERFYFTFISSQILLLNYSAFSCLMFDGV
jgi:hypothetical protein